MPLAALASLLLCSAFSAPARGEGFEMFPSVAFSTGEKPQSKVWYHDGFYWCIVQGPSGVAFYQLVNGVWQLGQFAGAVLQPNGQADVKWDGSNLFVGLYTRAAPKLYKYSYNSVTKAWVLRAGFPAALPTPSVASDTTETMVIDLDSTGRLWMTTEGAGNINVYYSTSADHATWSTTPIVLETGLPDDDISAVIAFGGNKIGVFWSDQAHGRFGFRVHRDADPPDAWSALEPVFPGWTHADDHVNLAADAQGRVYAATKDSLDNIYVHRRDANGAWITKSNILAGGIGTRPILQVSDQDRKVYFLYTRWGVVPRRIEYRVADIDSLNFGSETLFITSTVNTNNVSGMKQPLQRGALVAIGENGTKAMWNGVGVTTPGGPAPPDAPSVPQLTVVSSTRIDLSWSAPASGPTPSGYNVYRQLDGGAFQKLNSSPVAALTFSDASAPSGRLCYQVTAVANGLEGPASATACAGSTIPAPGPPQGLTAMLMTSSDTAPYPGSGIMVPASHQSGSVDLPPGDANQAALAVLLQWQPPTAGGTFTGYNVYRAINGGSYQRINSGTVSTTSFTDQALADGPHCYQVKAVGAQAEGTASNTACVTPPPPDHPPVVSAPSAISAAEGARISVQVNASDPDGDAITTLRADLSRLPAGHNARFIAGSGEASGTFEWTPTYNDAGGPCTVSFTASNALSGTASTAITVTNVDRAPVVTVPATARGVESRTITIQVTASDPDGSAITSLTADLSRLPAGNNARFTPGPGNTSGTLTWTPVATDIGGPYTVSFTARNTLSGSASTVFTAVLMDHPPQVSAPVVFTGIEGMPLTMLVGASDPDGDPITSLTADLTGLPPGNEAHFTTEPDHTVGRLTWTPVKCAGGPYVVRFIAENGLAGTGSTAITVDRPPVVTAVGATSCAEGSEITIEVTAGDANGEAIASLTADLSGLPAGNNAVFTGGAGNTTGTLRWTPTYADAGGPYPVTFTALNRLSGGTTTWIMVTQADAPPVVSAPAAMVGEPGRAISVDVTASDLDGDPIASLTADLTHLPPGNNAVFLVAANHASGRLTWFPTAQEAGSCPVTFTASNARTGSATTRITVYVDHAPLVDVPGKVGAAEGQPVTVAVSALDPDGEAITFLTANLSGLPAGNTASFTPGPGNTSGVLRWTPTYGDAGGPYRVTFTAANALSGSASTDIVVADVDRAPVVSAPATVSGTESIPVTVSVTAADPDGTPITRLTADLSGLPAGNNASFTPVPGNTSGVLRWTPTYADAGGPYRVSFTAANGLSGSVTASIMVANQDRAPVASAPPTVSGTENVPITVSVTAADPDGSPIAQLTADLSRLPAGNNASFTPGPGNASGVLRWTPTYADAGGPYRVTFTAANGLSGSVTTSITVADQDRPPEVSAPAVANAAEGVPMSLSVTASDPDGTPIGLLAADLSGLPAGNHASFSTAPDNSGGVLSWTPGFEDSGSYTVTFTAANAMSRAKSVTINVANTNRPPVALLSVGPSSSGVAPLTVTADGSASRDPDGPLGSYRFDFGDGTVIGPQASPTAAHAYAGGNWTLTLTVLDGSGASDTMCVPIVSVRTNLVSNASFEDNTAGWVSYGSGASITRVTGGRTGSFALQCKSTGGTSVHFGATDSPNWINPVAAVGTRYRFSAWVRSASSAGVVKIKVKEFLGSTQKGSTVYSVGTTLSTNWQIATIDYVVTTAGTTLDLVVEDYPVASSETYLLDDVSIEIVPQAPALAAGVQDLEAATSPLGRGAGATAGMTAAAAASRPAHAFGASLCPNPMSVEGTLQYALTRPGPVKAALFDARGRRVSTLLDERHVEAGRHGVRIDRRGADGVPLQAGIYFYRVETGEGTTSGRLVLLK